MCSGPISCSCNNQTALSLFPSRTLECVRGHSASNASLVRIFQSARAPNTPPWFRTKNSKKWHERILALLAVVLRICNDFALNARYTQQKEIKTLLFAFDVWHCGNPGNEKKNFNYRNAFHKNSILSGCLCILQFLQLGVFFSTRLQQAIVVVHEAH